MIKKATPPKRIYPNRQHAAECFQSASLSLASWTVLAEELHLTPDTPSTTTIQLHTLCLFHGQSWWKNYIEPLIRRRLFQTSFTIARFLDSLGGGTTSKKGQYTIVHCPFFGVVPSFKLHRSWWLRSQIVEHPIHVIHLIYYSIHHLLQH